MAGVQTPLARLQAGTRAVIDRITIPPSEQSRLLEMGLIAGTPVEIVRFAPLGDPIEIKVRGYHLTLRKEDAEQIWVTPASSP